MASIFCCFRGCANFIDLGFTSTQTVPIKKQPIIVLDSQQIGRKLLIVRINYV